MAWIPLDNPFSYRVASTFSLGVVVLYLPFSSGGWPVVQTPLQPVRLWPTFFWRVPAFHLPKSDCSYFSYCSRLGLAFEMGVVLSFRNVGPGAKTAAPQIAWCQTCDWSCRGLQGGAGIPSCLKTAVPWTAWCQRWDCSGGGGAGTLNFNPIAPAPPWPEIMSVAASLQNRALQKELLPKVLQGPSSFVLGWRNSCLPKLLGGSENKTHSSQALWCRKPLRGEVA